MAAGPGAGDVGERHGAVPRHADGICSVSGAIRAATSRGFKRLAVIEIPCQIYALRALEQKLGFERLYVVGTPCSDNTTTANFHRFLDLLSDDPDGVTYLEFRADFHVELAFATAASGDCVPPTANFEIAAGFLSDNLPHLYRLHQCAG
jgi:uncharacterized protein (DUF1684 family)